MADVSKNLKDAAYIAVGMGVIAFQKAQVRRVELTRQFESQRKAMEAQAAEAREQVSQFAKVVEERWEPAMKDLQQRLAEIEQRLPEQAASVVEQAKAAATIAQAEFAKRINRAA
jgi:hypothetical protein